MAIVSFYSVNSCFFTYLILHIDYFFCLTVHIIKYVECDLGHAVNYGHECAFAYWDNSQNVEAYKKKNISFQKNVQM
jgi:hypothetical protein